MAKLTLRFRDEIKQVHEFDSGIITIGRDHDNTICIDSLAIAPKHVIIDFDHPDGPRLIKEDDKFPVWINGKEIERHQLEDKDEISLGKHTIVFHARQTPADEPRSSPDFLDPLPKAGLQVLNGKNIGRLIPIKRSLIRLGNPGGSIAVISLRKDGFYLSSLDGGEQISINGSPLGERTVPLSNGDQLEIEKKKFLFYT